MLFPSQRRVARSQRSCGQLWSSRGVFILGRVLFLGGNCSQACARSDSSYPLRGPFLLVSWPCSVDDAVAARSRELDAKVLGENVSIQFAKRKVSIAVGTVLSHPSVFLGVFFLSTFGAEDSDPHWMTLFVCFALLCVVYLVLTWMQDRTEAVKNLIMQEVALQEPLRRERKSVQQR